MAQKECLTEGAGLLKTTWLSVLFAISITGAALVTVVAVLYSYDTISVLESAVGFVILLAVAGFMWAYRKRSYGRAQSGDLDKATFVGMVLGLLWLAEISINNVIAPPLPLRDDIDNAFWAVIALSIFVVAIVSAYQTDSTLHGTRVGAWLGLVSGLLACCTALSMIVFGMRFITQDPLNMVEWTMRGASASAPTMASYFAYETFAGAFLHLLILGLAMGGLLGVAGGLIGKCIKRVGRLARG
jgi:hypothetical protein